MLWSKSASLGSQFNAAAFRTCQRRVGPRGSRLKVLLRLRYVLTAIECEREVDCMQYQQLIEAVYGLFNVEKRVSRMRGLRDQARQLAVHRNLERLLEEAKALTSQKDPARRRQFAHMLDALVVHVTVGGAIDEGLANAPQAARAAQPASMAECDRQALVD